eukprot:4296728-Alexandrium_andersonii.AAC.1
MMRDFYTLGPLAKSGQREGPRLELGLGLGNEASDCRRRALAENALASFDCDQLARQGGLLP